MAPVSLVMVALTMPLSRVQEGPLSVMVTGAVWAGRVAAGSSRRAKRRVRRIVMRECSIGETCGRGLETREFVAARSAGWKDWRPSALRL